HHRGKAAPRQQLWQRLSFASSFAYSSLTSWFSAAVGLSTGGASSGTAQPGFQSQRTGGASNVAIRATETGKVTGNAGKDHNFIRIRSRVIQTVLPGKT